MKITGILINKLRSAPYALRTKAGFTIIEILIVLSIMSMLSGVMLVYSRSSEKLLILVREQARLISLITRAKSFALQTYTDGTSACGYGIHIDKVKNTAILFKDVVSGDLAEGCSISDNIYTASDESVEEFILNKDIYIKSSEATDVLFIPPDPQVVISDNGQVINQASIILETADNSSRVGLKINSSGQITTQ